MRKVLLLILIISLVGIAGCIDVADETTPEPEVTPTPELTPTPTPEATPTPTPSPPGELPDGVLTVHYLDVGQADATVIELPNDEIMVIDTGHWWDDGETVIAYLESLGVDRIDHLVSTHA